LIETPDKLILELQSKFNTNLNKSIIQNQNCLKRLFIKTRAISEIGLILKESNGLRSDQIEITAIFDEIFADIITSLYLAGSALDKPAQMVLRRALELSVAIVFLWDLPHLFYGWKNHDNDLNFNDMLKHLSDIGYLSYLSRSIPNRKSDSIIETETLQRIYRQLSNTIHGKISTFETNLVDRFQHNDSDWTNYLIFLEKVVDEIISLLFNRFELKPGLMNRLPAMRKMMEAKIEC